MQPIRIIKKLAALDGRLGRDEARACDLVCTLLNENGISYVKQDFKSTTPRFVSYSLKVDGQKVDCLPSGLKSGAITNNYNLISSLTSSQNFIDTPNINFNPRSDAICLCNFYFAPALAVSRKDVPRIMEAKIIDGRLEVVEEPYTATNILVGNARNPQSVVFAHYDAYFSGATDNASCVAAALTSAVKEPSLLANTLFVFAGNEELSYDYPIYWGRCFRKFNTMNPGLLRAARSIIVIDSIGDGEPVIETDPRSLSLAFPVDDTDILAKTKIVTGDFDSLMTVYHSQVDIAPRLSKDYLDQTIALIGSMLA